MKFSVEEEERNLSVVFELRSVRSIYALERSEELRPIRPSRVNACVWKLGQSRDKPYGRETCWAVAIERSFWGLISRMRLVKSYVSQEIQALAERRSSPANHWQM
jgi:hypothetical protein